MMKGKINLKTIIIVVILILIIVLGVLGMNTVRTYMSGASGGSEPQGVVATSSEDGKSAEVVWSTEKAVMAVVEYGTNPASLLLRGVESNETIDHRVTLSSLKPGVTYYFRFKVGDETFDNNGIPFSFKTKESLKTEETEIKIASTVTPVPSVVLVPTVSTSSAETCNRTSDYNKDGTVNSLDYTECLKNGGMPASSPTVGASNTTGSATDDCKLGTDYDGNGVINSLDRIKCLQNKR